MRWARRAGAGEFRYDALSYALNFDGATLPTSTAERRPAGGGRFLYRTFSSQLTPAPRAAVEAA